MASGPSSFAMLPSFLAYLLGADDKTFVHESWLQRALVRIQLGLFIVAGIVLMFLIAYFQPNFSIFLP